MQKVVYLVSESDQARDRAIVALRDAKVSFIERSTESILSEPPAEMEALVWVSLQADISDNLKSIRSEFPEVAIVLLVTVEDSDRLSSELLESVDGVVPLPSDPGFFNDIISLAWSIRNTERNIREIQNKIRSMEDEFSVFLSVGRAIASTLELNQVLTEIMNAAGRLIRSEAWSLALIDSDTEELVFFAARGDHAEEVKGLRLPRGTGVIGWVAQHGEPLIVADTRRDKRHFKDVDINVGFDSKSILCLPLRAKDKMLGAIEFINSIGEKPFSSSDIERIHVFIEIAAVSIENALLYQRVIQLSERDELTGLCNQRSLIKSMTHELQMSLKNGTVLGYLFLDLDYFKKINDQYGHLRGRQTLQEIGRLLQDITTDREIVGRYGGDEFWVIVPGTTKDYVLGLAEKIRSSIEKSVFLRDQGLEVRLTASVGVAFYPEQADSFDTLIQAADRALFHAKHKNRNTVFCDL